MTLRLLRTGTMAGSEIRMPDEPKTPVRETQPEERREPPAVPAPPGAHWNEFLRRNLLLASMTAAAASRRPPDPPSAAP